MKRHQFLWMLLWSVCFTACDPKPTDDPPKPEPPKPPEALNWGNMVGEYDCIDSIYFSTYLPSYDGEKWGDTSGGGTFLKVYRIEDHTTMPGVKVLIVEKMLPLFGGSIQFKFRQERYDPLQTGQFIIVEDYTGYDGYGSSLRVERDTLFCTIRQALYRNGFERHIIKGVKRHKTS